MLSSRTRRQGTEVRRRRPRSSVVARAARAAAGLNVRTVHPRDLGQRAHRAVCAPVAGLRTRGRFPARAGVSYRPSLPGRVRPVLSRSADRGRLSFPLTAAGQSRIRTGFPLASSAPRVSRGGAAEPPALGTLLTGEVLARPPRSAAGRGPVVGGRSFAACGPVLRFPRRAGRFTPHGRPGMDSPAVRGFRVRGGRPLAERAAPGVFASAVERTRRAPASTFDTRAECLVGQGDPGWMDALAARAGGVRGARR